MHDVQSAIQQQGASQFEREMKLRNAREVIGNALQPGRLCMGAINLYKKFIGLVS